MHGANGLRRATTRHGATSSSRNRAISTATTRSLDCVAHSTAKTHIRVGRIELEPSGRPTPIEHMMPTPSPDDPVLGPAGAPRILARTFGIQAVPIMAPLPHITVHVAKPPAIRRVRADPRCARVAAAPLGPSRMMARRFAGCVGVIAQRFASHGTVAPRPRGRCSCATCVFPLSFRWKTIGSASVVFTRHPVTQSKDVVPTDAGHGMIVCLRKTGLVPVELQISVPSSSPKAVRTATALGVCDITSRCHKP